MEHGDATIVDDVPSLDMESSRHSIYDRDVELRPLYQDPRSGAEHYVVRYPPGLTALAHRHSASHAIVVLRGGLRRTARSSGAVPTAISPRVR